MKQIILLFLVLSFNTTFTQIDKSAYYSFGKSFFIESYYFPSDSKDTSEIVIIFKIANEVIPFVKIYNDTRGEYLANPTVEVTCRDADGIVRYRGFWTDSIFTKNYDFTVSKKDFAYGIFKTKLKNDIYEIQASYNVKNNLRDSKTKDKLNLMEGNFKKQIGKPIFSKLTNFDFMDNIEPFLLEYNIAFGSVGARLTLPVFNNNPQQYLFQCKTTNKDDDENIFYSGIANLKQNVNLKFIKNENGKCAFNIDKYSNENLFNILELEIPPDKLDNSDYEVLLFAESSLDTLRIPFKSIWENEPLSIKNIDYAIEMMFYILSDEEYEEMKIGSSKEIKQKFKNYWKNIDPSPNTKFNESLNQYFTRVDYTFFNFQTIVEKDGAKTDRGKIYILYGAPDEVTDTFFEKNKQITWKYKKLNKTFVFETLGESVFKLIKIIE